MNAAQIVISGVGFVTSIGNDRATVSRSLRHQQSGIEKFDYMPGVNLPVKVAGTLKGFNTTATLWPGWLWPEGPRVPKDVLRGLPPHGLQAFFAVEQVIGDARLTENELKAEDTGLFCSSAGSPRLMRHYLNQINETRGERIAPMAVVSTIAGTLNFNLAAHYGIRGAVAGFVAACASTTQALGYAFDEIALGRLRRVLVVGGEDLSWESVYPFHGMRALSRNPDPARASRPFDRSRDGFVGTGGAAALLLESAESAQQRGAPIYAQMVGWGQAADGHSVAISDPSGAGLATAMRRALTYSKLSAGEIDYINAHATSTAAGDAAEARALQSVFSAEGWHPPVSSTKGLTGHGLSMAGVMEMAFCCVGLAEGFIPGTANLEEPDPVCAGLNLPRETLSARPRFVLKNSSGFGGTNVSVVLRRWEK
jgi:3-oxoacyl-(acyl-carrier-protein) synthase